MKNPDPKVRFKEFVENDIPNLSKLPFVHITDGYHLEDILKPKKLVATQCKVFSKEILYMFYGKPAYRTKHGGTNFLSCHLPCVFIFDPEKIETKIKGVYPFDTGAFKNGMYSSFFHQETQVEDFILSPNITAAQNVVQSFFQSNREYFEGRSRKNVEIPPMNFEVEGYIELSRSPSHPESNSRLRADERAFAVELQFHEDIDLKDSLLACILPTAFLDLKEISDSLNEINPDIIKTYSSIHKLSYEGLAGKIYEIVETIYSEKDII